MNSRTKKVLIGIGVVLGGLAVLGIAFIVSLVVWISRPTPLADVARLLTPRTTGFIELRLEQTDGGTIRFLERLQASAVRNDAGTVPESVDVISGQDLAEALPLVAAWSMAPTDPPSEDESHVVLVSAPRFGRYLTIVDELMGFADGDGREVAVHRHGNERIYDVATSDFRGAIFIREGTLFLTSNVETAAAAVDLFAAERSREDSDNAASLLKALLDRADPSAPLRGAVSNRNGELLRLWELSSGGTLGAQFRLENVDGVFLTGALDGDGGLVARATIVAPGTEWSDVQVSAVRSSMESAIGGRLGRNQVTVERIGSDLAIDISVPGFAEGLAGLEQTVSNRNR